MSTNLTAQKRLSTKVDPRCNMFMPRRQSEILQEKISKVKSATLKKNFEHRKRMFEKTRYYIRGPESSRPSTDRQRSMSVSRDNFKRPQIPLTPPERQLGQDRSEISNQHLLPCSRLSRRSSHYLLGPRHSWRSALKATGVTDYSASPVSSRRPSFGHVSPVRPRHHWRP